jgi:hypothetical protein
MVVSAFGLWATRRNPKGLLIGSIIVIMVLVYTTYWIGATLFGMKGSDLGYVRIGDKAGLGTMDLSRVKIRKITA